MTVPQVALVVLSDRPADLYLNRALASIAEHVDYSFAQTIVFADEEHRVTASGAVREAWAQVDPDIDWLVSWEEDFLANEPVDIPAMMDVLEAEPSLAHLVLLRQPWSQPEIDAGGIIPLYADNMIDRVTCGHPWVQHDRFFSLNPCLVPRRVFEDGFPEGSEPAMTQRLLDRGFHFGYWGARSDAPRVNHIGEIRAAGSVR